MVEAIDTVGVQHVTTSIHVPHRMHRLTGTLVLVGLALPVSQGAPSRLVNGVPTEFEITADRDQMLRVFLNLMRNSLQALAPPPGQKSDREAQITVSAASEGGTSIILVEDNGPGLPAAARQRLFEPFSPSSTRFSTICRPSSTRTTTRT